MKWGVRRTREQLGYERISVKTANGISVKSISKHALRQMEERHVTRENIVDALRNPLYIRDVHIDNEGQKSQRFIGWDATVNVNPDTGNIATIWKTGKDDKRKYSKGGA
jgi:hypothetical protein